MSGIRDDLIEICEDIVEENNKKLDQEEYKNTGISNHIFSEKSVQMKIGFELINKLKLDNKLQFERKIFNEKLQKKDYLDIFLLTVTALAGQYFNSESYKYGETNRVVILSYSRIVFSTFIGFFFLDEKINFMTIAGIFIIIFTTYFVRKD